MIRVTVNNRGVQAIPLSPVTVGSEGIVCAFLFSDDWAGLAKTAIFKGSGEEVEKIVLNNECTVPPEVLAEAGGMLQVGVYGNDGHGTTIRPTIWSVVGRIEDGAISEDAGQTGTTPSWAAQVQTAIQEIYTSEAARVAAESARVTAEEGRVDAEEDRADAEAARAAAEAARAAAETSRASAETSRASAESSRASAESSRASAETARASAEADRVEAEEYREEKYVEYVETVSGYADAASASASAAASSAAGVAGYASAAVASAEQAASSASAAAASASQAADSATTASESAESAASSAESAAADASTATSKASAAASSASSAANAVNAAYGAANRTEQIANNMRGAYQQIGQNATDISYLMSDKQDAPAAAGTAGQVLGLDANLNPVWVDQSGSVTSVNGKTGAVTLDASDVGAGTYSKPSGGIPATDLASAVQASLGKADTALQTAPVSSVAGKTGSVTLDAGDVEFDETETYAAGSIGAEVSAQKNAIEQKQDATQYVTLSGTIVTQTGADNTMYLCGELAELTFTALATGITAIRFTSGTTPTVVTLNGITMPDDWTGAEASTTYEINVLNGLGAWQSWT